VRPRLLPTAEGLTAMCTVMTHAVVGLGLGKLFTGRRMPFLFWEMAAVLAALPDIDVLTFQFGIKYDTPYGHRGCTHSLAFALIVSFGVTLLTYRRLAAIKWWYLWPFFFIALASHGFLDAFTDGGYGIEFFWPFDTRRFFFPWRPLRVPHFGAKLFLTQEGIERFGSELIWVWCPTILVVGTIVLFRQASRERQRPEESKP
jgi:inner membrane protein